MSDILELLANTADGAFATDTEGRIVYWNPGAQAILGWVPGQVLGRRCRDLIRGLNETGELICNECCHVMRAGLGEAVQNYNLETHDHLNRAVWINLSTLSVPANEPSLGLTIHFFRDVTASRQLELLVSRSLAAGIEFDGAQMERLPLQLTPRELEVLRLMSGGLGTSAIAMELGISGVTARNHIQHILHKLAVHSRLEAVAFAWQSGLLEAEVAQS